MEQDSNCRPGRLDKIPNEVPLTDGGDLVTDRYFLSSYPIASMLAGAKDVSERAPRVELLGGLGSWEGLRRRVGRGGVASFGGGAVEGLRFRTARSSC